MMDSVPAMGAAPTVPVLASVEGARVKVAAPCTCAAPDAIRVEGVRVLTAEPCTLTVPAEDTVAAERFGAPLPDTATTAAATRTLAARDRLSAPVAPLDCWGSKKSSVTLMDAPPLIRRTRETPSALSVFDLRKMFKKQPQ